MSETQVYRATQDCSCLRHRCTEPPKILYDKVRRCWAATQLPVSTITSPQHHNTNQTSIVSQVAIDAQLFFTVLVSQFSTKKLKLVEIMVGTTKIIRLLNSKGLFDTLQHSVEKY